MSEEQPSFDCLCRKCGVEYKSADIRDTDDDGLCSPCKEKTKAIAENVQKIINQRRASRPIQAMKPKPQNMPGTSFINARDLLL